MTNYTILLYYKYTPIDNTQELKSSQLDICQQLNLTGRTIIASEGINATLEGTTKNIKSYIQNLVKDPRFRDIHFKKSPGNGQAFPKLSIKVRSEIVSSRLGNQDIKPYDTTAEYITADELHTWFRSGKEFYIIDMRNDYEHRVGKFTNSIPSGMASFIDLPNVIGKINDLSDKPIVTVCTGGVRCEKASGYLVRNGFKNVRQLYGGIVTYMEKYPNQDFLGKLYVFDNRILMGFNTDSPEHIVIGKCEKCLNSSENFVNCGYDLCHRHFICCTKCFALDNFPYCNDECQNQANNFRKLHPNSQRKQFYQQAGS